MAIDSTLFAADIPAGTYAKGDIIPMGCIDGPANVRSGRGVAKLKNIMVGMCTNGPAYFKIHVKNSDWIDDVESFPWNVYTPTAFDEDGGLSQRGHDCNLTPNSGWQVYAEVLDNATTTIADSVYALVDVDYPQVGGVTDPKNAVGFPTSISYNKTLTTNAIGALSSAVWVSESVDYLKAGYRYVLDTVEVFATNAAVVGFIAFSNAAGMGGLTRIIPVNSIPYGVRNAVKYSSVLVKGPMDVKLKLLTSTAQSADILTVHDYVKQKA